MTTKPTNKIANACLYFSTSKTYPLKQTIFQQHLSALQNANKDKLLQYKIQELLIERYYEMIKNYQKFKIEQYLILRFIELITQLIKNKNQCNQQELIIIIWAAISHLKKLVPENQNKQIIKITLNLIQISVTKILKNQNCKPQTIYPQLSASLMHYVIHSHLINHGIFATSLRIMGELIQKIFQKSIKQDKIKLKLDFNNIQSKQKSFDQQCLSRLQSYLIIMTNKIPTMELVYYDSISSFVQKLWKVGQKHIKILCSLAVLGQLANSPVSYQSMPSSLTKLIQSSMTKQFISILDTPKSNILHHNSILQKLQKLASTLNPTQQQYQYLLLKFTNCFYLVQNSKSLIIPQTQVKQSLHLINLQGFHNFANYPIGISSLLESSQFQCERILLVKMPYAETSLSNINLLKRILQRLPQHVANMLLSRLLQALALQQNQYMVDMSLTKFCQFVTKILIVYWLVRKLNFKLHSDIALNLFQTLSSCQAIRILQPSFQQQQILIGFTLLICYHCYNSLTLQKPQKNGQKELSQIKKLKLRLTMLQMAINNVYESSYIIRSAAYYIILSQSAPQSITQFLSNLQSTLINRNINNLNFIISLIQLCQLSSSQCEDLAQKFMQHPGSQQLLRILLPRLKTETIRKCLLSASNQRGKWIHMLKGNTKLLFNMKIQQSQQLQSKVNNFYMNDGSNVRISNALGVVLLELGSKWQYVLKNDSAFKQPALDLLTQLVYLEPNMVFFKNRFVTILSCLAQILQQPEYINQNNLNSTFQRTRNKIYKIIAKIPDVNFKFYKKIIEQPASNLLISKLPQKLLSNLLQNIQLRHKKYQLNYLMNSTSPQSSEMYDNSDAIITKIINAIQNREQEKQKQDQKDEEITQNC